MPKPGAGSMPPFKTTMCQSHKAGRKCAHGQACVFAHGKAELEKYTEMANKLAATATAAAAAAAAASSSTTTAASGSGASTSASAAATPAPAPAVAPKLLPVESRPPGYKTKMCSNWELLGACHRGERCHFAHGKDDLLLFVPMDKSQMCYSFSHTGSCIHGDHCKWAHGRVEFKVGAGDALITNPFYKTSLCYDFLRGGVCALGDACKYAHGRGELRGTDGEDGTPAAAPWHGFDLYKTQLCFDFLNGICPQGTACKYAHGREELRGAAAAAQLQPRKPKSCNNWTALGSCHFGNSCAFAHGHDDPRFDASLPSGVAGPSVPPASIAKPFTVDLRKTALCFAFMRGEVCMDGDACKYAHGEADLRHPTPIVPSAGAPPPPPPPRSTAPPTAAVPLYGYTPLPGSQVTAALAANPYAPLFSQTTSSAQPPPSQPPSAQPLASIPLPAPPPLPVPLPVAVDEVFKLDWVEQLVVLRGGGSLTEQEIAALGELRHMFTKSLLIEFVRVLAVDRCDCTMLKALLPAFWGADRPAGQCWTNLEAVPAGRYLLNSLVHQVMNKAANRQTRDAAFPVLQEIMIARRESTLDRFSPFPLVPAMTPISYAVYHCMEPAIVQYVAPLQWLRSPEAVAAHWVVNYNVNEMIKQRQHNQEYLLQVQQVLNTIYESGSVGIDISSMYSDREALQYMPSSVLALAPPPAPMAAPAAPVAVAPAAAVAAAVALAAAPASTFAPHTADVASVVLGVQGSQVVADSVAHPARGNIASAVTDKEYFDNLDQPDIDDFLDRVEASVMGEEEGSAGVEDGDEEDEEEGERSEDIEGGEDEEEETEEDEESDEYCDAGQSSEDDSVEGVDVSTDEMVRLALRNRLEGGSRTHGFLQPSPATAASGKPAATSAAGSSSAPPAPFKRGFLSPSGLSGTSATAVSSSTAVAAAAVASINATMVTLAPDAAAAKAAAPTPARPVASSNAGATPQTAPPAVKAAKAVPPPEECYTKPQAQTLLTRLRVACEISEVPMVKMLLSQVLHKSARASMRITDRGNIDSTNKEMVNQLCQCMWSAATKGSLAVLQHLEKTLEGDPDETLNSIVMRGEWLRFGSAREQKLDVLSDPVVNPSAKARVGVLEQTMLSKRWEAAEFILARDPLAAYSLPWHPVAFALHCADTVPDSLLHILAARAADPLGPYGLDDYEGHVDMWMQARNPTTKETAVAVVIRHKRYTVLPQVLRCFRASNACSGSLPPLHLALSAPLDLIAARIILKTCVTGHFPTPPQYLVNIAEWDQDVLPLNLAVEAGSEEAVKLLVEHGADPWGTSVGVRPSSQGIKVRPGTTQPKPPIVHAFSLPNTAVSRMLLHQLVETKDLGKQLTSVTDDSGMTCLMYACKAGNLGLIKRCLDLKADITRAVQWPSQANVQAQQKATGEAVPSVTRSAISMLLLKRFELTCRGDDAGATAIHNLLLENWRRHPYVNAESEVEYAWIYKALPAGLAPLPALLERIFLMQNTDVTLDHLMEEFSSDGLFHLGEFSPALVELLLDVASPSVITTIDVAAVKRAVAEIVAAACEPITTEDTATAVAKRVADLIKEHSAALKAAAAYAAQVPFSWQKMRISTWGLFGRLSLPAHAALRTAVEAIKEHKGQMGWEVMKQSLIEAAGGSTLDLLLPSKGSGLPPFHLAMRLADFDAGDLLLSYGCANTNIKPVKLLEQQWEGLTPLYLAVRSNKLDAAAFLVKHGARALGTVTTAKGEDTPLHQAVRGGLHGLVQLMLAGRHAHEQISPEFLNSVVDYAGLTVLACAIDKQRTNCVLPLLEAGASFVHPACGKAHDAAQSVAAGTSVGSAATPPGSKKKGKTSGKAQAGEAEPTGLPPGATPLSMALVVYKDAAGTLPDGLPAELSTAFLHHWRMEAWGKGSTMQALQGVMPEVVPLIRTFLLQHWQEVMMPYIKVVKEEVAVKNTWTVPCPALVELLLDLNAAAVDVINATAAKAEADGMAETRLEESIKRAHSVVAPCWQYAKHAFRFSSPWPLLSAYETYVKGALPLQLFKRLAYATGGINDACFFQGSIAGRRLLHKAVMDDDSQALSDLLDCGADPRLKDSSGSTPMHLAAETLPDSSLARIMKVLALTPFRISAALLRDGAGRTPAEAARTRKARGVIEDAIKAAMSVFTAEDRAEVKAAVLEADAAAAKVRAAATAARNAAAVANNAAARDAVKAAAAEEAAAAAAAASAEAAAKAQAAAAEKKKSKKEKAGTGGVGRAAGGVPITQVPLQEILETPEAQVYDVITQLIQALPPLAVLPSTAAETAAAAAVAASAAAAAASAATTANATDAALRRIVEDMAPDVHEDSSSQVMLDEAEFSADDEESGTDFNAEAAAAEAAGRCSGGGLLDDDLLKELPWHFVITREARATWATMQDRWRQRVLDRLHVVGLGRWARCGGSKCVNRADPEMWRLKIDRAGRILFEVAVEYDEATSTWMEMIRLWCITMDHKKYEDAIDGVHASFKRAAAMRERLRLEMVRTVGAAGGGAAVDDREAVGGRTGARPPKSFKEVGSTANASPTKNTGGKATAAKPTIREHFPPASYGADTYTLLKFYNLDGTLVKSVLEGLDDAQVDFPFKVSPKEQALITKQPSPPSSMILLGRSGTGKTTVAVYRIWGQWLRGYKGFSAEPTNVLFITASATLREQVAKAFRRLQGAVMPPAEFQRVVAASEAQYHSFVGVPTEAFPMFLPSKTYLRMLDGSTAKSFFPRRANGSIIQLPDDSDDLDPDGMQLTVDLEYLMEDDEDEGGGMGQGGADDEADQEVQLDVERAAAAAAAAATAARDGGDEDDGAGAGGVVVTRELTYSFFVHTLWRMIADGKMRERLRPGLLYQEIVSYLKGSAEAVSSPGGKLAKEAYLVLGKKRAPNFDADLRRDVVYPLFEKYEKERVAQRRYDAMDVVAHVFAQLRDHGYRGTPIHGLYRDEVQDFTQAEMLVDLRVCSDPNALFYCGDTAQTIARGIGFRFDDIRTLFYEENERRMTAKGAAAALTVATPSIEQLTTNYRTHQGVLDVAALLVEMLRRYFPLQVDKLERENALFTGPHPLLLGGISAEDLCILLSGSDRHTSQVEFGAHQVILVRSMEAMEKLPPEIRDSNAILMTVPQAKGLEFDDVFLVDFFADSEATTEWRVLNSFLEEVITRQEDAALSLSTTSNAGTHTYSITKKDAEDAAATRGSSSGTDSGALRPLDFDMSKHVLLSDELKHLYTAITRAKNNVVIFDRNGDKRAPFYNLLQRLGVARTVQKGLLEDGQDAVKFGLTQQATSSRAEWAKRARNLRLYGNYPMAAKSYLQAEDMIRATVCEAYHKRSQAADAVGNTPEQCKLLANAALHLLSAVLHSEMSPDVVPDRERMRWAQIAIRCMEEGGKKLATGVAATAKLYIKLGQYMSALKLLEDSRDHESAAHCCMAAALYYSGGPAAQQTVVAAAQRGEKDAMLATAWLRKAVEQYHLRGDHSAMLQVLELHTGLAAQLAIRWPDYNKAMTETAIKMHAKGDHARAKVAISFLEKREQKLQVLQELAYWKEAARLQAPTEPLAAAKLLASHNEPDEAEALLVSLQWPQGRQPEPEIWSLLLRLVVDKSDISSVQRALAAVQRWPALEDSMWRVHVIGQLQLLLARLLLQESQAQIAAAATHDTANATAHGTTAAAGTAISAAVSKGGVASSTTADDWEETTTATAVAHSAEGLTTAAAGASSAVAQLEQQQQQHHKQQLLSQAVSAARSAQAVFESGKSPAHRLGELDARTLQLKLQPVLAAATARSRPSLTQERNATSLEAAPSAAEQLQLSDVSQVAASADPDAGVPARAKSGGSDQEALSVSAAVAQLEMLLVLLTFAGNCSSSIDSAPHASNSTVFQYVSGMCWYYNMHNINSGAQSFSMGAAYLTWKAALATAALHTRWDSSSGYASLSSQAASGRNSGGGKAGANSSSNSSSTAGAAAYSAVLERNGSSSSSSSIVLPPPAAPPSGAATAQLHLVSAALLTEQELQAHVAAAAGVMPPRDAKADAAAAKAAGADGGNGRSGTAGKEAQPMSLRWRGRLYELAAADVASRRDVFPVLAADVLAKAAALVLSMCEQLLTAARREAALGPAEWKALVQAEEEREAAEAAEKQRKDEEEKERREKEEAEKARLEKQKAKEQGAGKPAMPSAWGSDKAKQLQAPKQLAGKDVKQQLSKQIDALRQPNEEKKVEPPSPWDKLCKRRVLPLLKVLEAGKKLRKQVLTTCGFYHATLANVDMVLPGLSAALETQAATAWSMLLTTPWPILPPAELYQGMRHPKKGLQALLTSHNLQAREVDAWLHKLLDSEEGPDTTLHLKNKLVLHPSIAYAAWRMWGLALQDSRSAARRIKLSVQSLRKSLPRSLFINIGGRRGIPEDALGRAFEEFHNGIPDTALDNLCYYLMWSAARDGLAQPAPGPGRAAGVHPLPLESYVELLEMAAIHLGLGLAEGEASLVPSPLLNLLTGIPQLNGSFSASEQLQYWDQRQGTGKLEPAVIRQLIASYSHTLLVVANHLLQLLQQATADAAVASSDSSTVNVAMPEQPQEWRRWAPLSERVSKAARAAFPLSLSAGHALVSAGIIPPGLSSTPAAATAASPAAFSGTSSATATGLASACAAATSAAATAVWLQQLAVRLLPTPAALMLTMLLHDATLKGPAKETAGRFHADTPAMDALRAATAALGRAAALSFRSAPAAAAATGSAAAGAVSTAEFNMSSSGEPVSTATATLSYKAATTNSTAVSRTAPSTRAVTPAAAALAAEAVPLLRKLREARKLTDLATAVSTLVGLAWPDAEYRLYLVFKTKEQAFDQFPEKLGVGSNKVDVRKYPVMASLQGKSKSQEKQEAAAAVLLATAHEAIAKRVSEVFELTVNEQQARIRAARRIQDWWRACAARKVAAAEAQRLRDEAAAAAAAEAAAAAAAAADLAERKGLAAPLLEHLSHALSFRLQLLYFLRVRLRKRTHVRKVQEALAQQAAAAAVLAAQGGHQNAEQQMQTFADVDRAMAGLPGAALPGAWQQQGQIYQMQGQEQGRQMHAGGDHLMWQQQQQQQQLMLQQQEQLMQQQGGQSMQQQQSLTQSQQMQALQQQHATQALNLQLQQQQHMQQQRTLHMQQQMQAMQHARFHMFDTLAEALKLTSYGSEGKCPFCPNNPAANTSAAANNPKTAMLVPSSVKLPAKPSGLSAAAPLYVPHMQKPEHAANVAAFKEFLPWFQQMLCPLLNHAESLQVQLASLKEEAAALGPVFVLTMAKLQLESALSPVHQQLYNPSVLLSRRWAAVHAEIHEVLAPQLDQCCHSVGGQINAYSQQQRAAATATAGVGSQQQAHDPLSQQQVQQQQQQVHHGGANHQQPALPLHMQHPSPPQMQYMQQPQAPQLQHAPQQQYQQPALQHPAPGTQHAMYPGHMESMQAGQQEQQQQAQPQGGGNFQPPGLQQGMVGSGNWTAASSSNGVPFLDPAPLMLPRGLLQGGSFVQAPRPSSFSGPFVPPGLAVTGYAGGPITGVAGAVSSAISGLMGPHYGAPGPLLAGGAAPHTGNYGGTGSNSFTTGPPRTPRQQQQQQHAAQNNPEDDQLIDELEHDDFQLVGQGLKQRRQDAQRTLGPNAGGGGGWRGGAGSGTGSGAAGSGGAGQGGGGSGPRTPNKRGAGGGGHNYGGGGGGGNRRGGSGRAKW